MPYGMYISAEGAHAFSKRLEVIANNMANVDTVGFKRDLARLEARYAEAVEQGDVAPDSGSIEEVGGGVEVVGTVTDFAPGPMKHTGGDTDLAIRGDGFFAVERDGEVHLTRAGNFRLTETGQVVTEFAGQQYNVLGSNMTPMYVLPGTTDWNFNEDGTLSQPGQRQSLALVRPQSEADLVKIGGNLFHSLSEIEPIPQAERSVAVGYLEGSSVNPTSEMVAMIEASRAVEANVKMMQTQDQMLSGLVNRVMRVS